jgi:hypothetical protein
MLGLVHTAALGDVRPINPGIGPNTAELLPYEASGYRYQIIGLGIMPPSGFEQPAFDDRTWSIGTGAFGSGGGCPLQPTVQTFWPVNSQLLVRHTISIPVGATNIRIMVSVDNDILGAFFNGTSITGFISHDFCPIVDEFRLDVPEALVQPGQNLVVLQVLDRGVESFFDTRVLAEVPASIDVAVDIRPQGCPNPLNTKAQGVLPVAILGAATFDVTKIDVASVKLEGVSPLRSAVEDVATPFVPFTGKTAAFDCTAMGSDGFSDLTLQFDNQAVVAALGAVTDGEVRVLNLTGNLRPAFGGTPIVGEDVVVLHNR